MKHFLRAAWLVSLLIPLTAALVVPPKPHLIVGNWQLLENQRHQNLWTKAGKKYSIERLAFSSDEIGCSVALLHAGNPQEISTTYGFRVFEPFDAFESPVLLMKDLCDQETRLVFSILTLNKRYMHLKFEAKASTSNNTIAAVVLKFERTAGPPENMDDSRTVDR